MDSTDNIILQRKQFIIETIAKFCDKCGTPYTVDDVNIVQNTGISTIIHFSCHNCKSKHIANFLSPLGMTQGTPINTDLDISEIGRFMSIGGIDTQEILDVYEKLEDNDSVRI